MLKKIINYFDRLEDKIRTWLSRHPILYAFIGGTGVVLFWRGIWHTADFLTERYLMGVPREVNSSIDLLFPFWWDGMFSLILGSVLLLSTGLWVSNLIGTEILISGVSRGKKELKKAESDLVKESFIMEKMERRMKEISNRLEKIEQKLDSKY